MPPIKLFNVVLKSVELCCKCIGDLVKLAVEFFNTCDFVAPEGNVNAEKFLELVCTYFIFDAFKVDILCLGNKADGSFDGIYLSYELHLAKPDPKVFEHILEDAGIRAEETLFFDDSQVNLDAAAALGFQTYLVDVQEDFRHVFEELEK